MLSLKECVKIKPGNVIVSPLSVANALALLSQGTSGQTFEELKNGLHLTSDKAVAASQFLEQRETLEKSVGNATLSIANQIYIQEGQSLNKNFQEVAVSKFKSGIDSLNFAESEKSAQTINQFVEEKTNGKIKDLIKPDQLDADTRTVLVNAIYFKGNWEHQFEKEDTRKGDFYISETEKVPVDFMYMRERFNFAFVKDLDSKALEMKYANSNLSFVIILPYSRTGLAAVESKLKNYDLTKIAESMQYERSVDVYIPKFKVEYDIKLNDVLTNVSQRNELNNIRSNNFNVLFSDGNERNVF